MVLIHRDPTDLFQKQIQKAITQCPTIIHILQKHIMQMKPNAPYLNVLIKIHEQDAPIWPVVNNRPTRAYKLEKFLTNQLTQFLQLPYTYALKNTSEVANELSNLHIDNQHRMATFDIKDLYVKLPIRDIIQATKFWLNRQHTQPPPYYATNHCPNAHSTESKLFSI
jgi:5-bromo-4-chloroindolyl phosphate hydrolysis protein